MRVVTLPEQESSGATHALRIELRGTWAAFGLSLTASGTDTWTFTGENDTLSLEGSVTRDEDTLTLAISGGSFEDDGGTITLESTSLELSALGED